MKTSLALFAGLALVAAPVWADDVEVESKSSIEHGKHGSFEATSETERHDEHGKMTKKTDVDVDLDADGEGEAKRETKIVNDPKGLLNKTTTKIEETKKVDDGKVVLKQKKTVDGDVVEEHETTH